MSACDNNNKVSVYRSKDKHEPKGKDWALIGVHYTSGNGYYPVRTCATQGQAIGRVCI